MFEEMEIERELARIRDLIVACGSQIDYSQHIRDIKPIVKRLQRLKKNASDRAEFERLQDLECKALIYLNTMNKCQANFENQR